jgi:2-keto-3-deoxy-6-phosphogluconate aldolase
MTTPGGLSRCIDAQRCHGCVEGWFGLRQGFPSGLLGGASYIKALKAPFPDIHLVASGGVTQQIGADFILAGAAAVGIG